MTLSEEEIEARLRTLTAAQRDAYREMMQARSGEWRWAHPRHRRFETLAAVVDAGLAEWRSSYPDAAPNAKHFIVPLGTPTHEELKRRREQAAEQALTDRAQGVLDRANHLNVFNDRVDPVNLLELVREIIRELTQKGT